jgi:hypothetical protein
MERVPELPYRSLICGIVSFYVGLSHIHVRYEQARSALQERINAGKNKAAK